MNVQKARERAEEVINPLFNHPSTGRTTTKEAEILLFASLKSKLNKED